ncbi:MAG: SGNH/GDSL hydrolase family protein [Calditrichaeota bacterium]|nr:SGNH/GDSL hydrolase family protein [Calditrichota bacterium]
MKDRFLMFVIFPLFFLISILSTVFICEHISLIPDLGNKEYLFIVIAITSIYFLNLQWVRRKSKYIIILIANILAIEILLQIAALAGIIPGMRIMWRTPFGRSYHSAEGFSNGFMNRQGWHYANFDADSTAHRIALIGDSFIEAHEIPTKKHLGVRLESVLNSKKPEDPFYKVSALGITGAGPAQYLEILKFGYRHLKPETAIVFLFLGNDFSNSLHEAESNMRKPPVEYIYYTLDDSGELALLPGSEKAREDLFDAMESNYSLSPGQLVKTGFGYILLPQIVGNVFQKIRSMLKKNKHLQESADEVEQDFNRIGLAFDAFIFRQPVDSTGEKAYAIVEKLMLKMQRFSEQKGIDLIFVTIPHFPEVFFRNQTGANWSMVYNNYDFLSPENRLSEFATSQQLTFWKTGAWLQESGMTVEDVQSLYFLDGSGHLTPKGHALFAKFIGERLQFHFRRKQAFHIAETPEQ